MISSEVKKKNQKKKTNQKTNETHTHQKNNTSESVELTGLCFSLWSLSYLSGWCHCSNRQCYQELDPVERLLDSWRDTHPENNKCCYFKGPVLVSSFLKVKGRCHLSTLVHFRKDPVLWKPVFLMGSLLSWGPLSAAGKVTVVDKLDGVKLRVISRSGGKLQQRKLTSEMRGLLGLRKEQHVFI